MVKRVPGNDDALRVALIERDHAWETACDGLERARHGQGSVVLFDGPPGLGKSTLIAAVAEVAAETGMDVLSASGRRHEAGFGFGVMVQLFETRLERADEAEREWILSEASNEGARILTPGSRQAEPSFDTVHGLYRMCAKLASIAPLAVLVDDLDLADWQSMRCLSYLVERVADLPVAMVLAAGSLPRSQVPELFEIMGAPVRTARCPLAPLTRAGTAARVLARWPDARAQDRRDIEDASGGCPFLIDALVAGRVGGGGAPEPPIAAWAFKHASLIDAAAPRLLEAVAVLGADAHLGHVAALTGLDSEMAARAAGLLVEAGILKGETLLSFAYPVVAEALAASQPQITSAAAHLRAARLIDTEEVSPEAVASHLLRASRTASEWVIDTLCAAAAIALGRGAPANAVRYLRRALEEPPAPKQRAHVILELGRAEAMAGEPEAAVRLTEGASRYAIAGPEEPAAALATARALLALGQTEDALRAIERAIARGDAAPAAIRQLQAAQAAAGWLGSVADGASLADEPRPSSADTPGDRTLLALHAMDAAIRGVHCREVRELAVRALANGALLGDETADGMPYYLAVGALIVAEDLQTAELAATAAVEDAQARGSVLGFATASAARATTIAARGRLTDAVTEARNAVAAEQHGWRLGLAAARLVIAYGLMEKRDLPAAEQQLVMAGAVAGDADPGRLGLLVMRGQLHLLNGDPARALEDFRASGDLGDRAGASNPALLAWRSGAALACAALGDVAEAERCVEAELSLAQSFGAPGPIVRALRVMASISSPELAIETLEAAVDTVEGSQAALERARTLVEYGAALRRSGRRREARSPLRAGLDLAERCGAEALVVRAMREATAAGARPRRTALTGLNSLTVRERQVASLAAEGLSNREIAETLVVTVKTVEWHLNHSYRKLGVSSRDGLRDFIGSN